MLSDRTECMQSITNSEIALYDRLKACYDELQCKKNLFYMFFTTDLLHWVVKSLSFVPKHITVILIASDLSSDELDWLAVNSSRPFVHIHDRIDDKSVWQVLFLLNEENFGWIDIDCMVLNPAVFDEMLSMDDGTIVNTAWTYNWRGLDILHTYFLFVNVRVIEKLRFNGIAVSPSTFTYEPSSLGRRIGISQIPSEADLAILRTILPVDENNIPMPPKPGRSDAGTFYDTLVVYSLLAMALGYHLNKIRDLSQFNENSLGNSDELVHIGGVSWRLEQLSNDPLGSEFTLLYLQANYFLLEQIGVHLPEQYSHMKKCISGQLTAYGLSLDQVSENLRQYLALQGLTDEGTMKLMLIDRRAWNNSKLDPDEERKIDCRTLV